MEPSTKILCVLRPHIQLMVQYTTHPLREKIQTLEAKIQQLETHRNRLDDIWSSIMIRSIQFSICAPLLYTLWKGLR